MSVCKVKPRLTLKSCFVATVVLVLIHLLLHLRRSSATVVPLTDQKNEDRRSAVHPNKFFGFHNAEKVENFWNEHQQTLPSLYEVYASGEIHSGLIPTEEGFLLNNIPFKIFGGAIHYFRVHPLYWRDRLRKLRAAGFTVVETYVPWNLHEPQRDWFDFGQGGTDWSQFLDIVSYIKIAQEEDLFVIVRPGPFICAEWDFGGLPSWLLRDPTMRVRTSYAPFLERVNRYFEQLLPRIADLQFTNGKGPIIAFQVENEYGAFGYDDQPRDKRYLLHLQTKMQSLGLKEMFFTSDSPLGTLDWGSIPGALQTANFQSNVAGEFNALLQLQPDKPLMVTEFWTGWFDHWTEQHHTVPLGRFNSTLKEILDYGASVNFYMFHGGTNFGFMNGANVVNEFPYYLPDVTSYDYDAPLNESGDYTAKYEVSKLLISQHLPVKTRLPIPPSENVKVAYGPVVIESFLTFGDLLYQLPEAKKVTSRHLLAMEDLPINNMNGQSYGFVVYRKKLDLENDSEVKIRGHVRDLAYVLVNGQLQNQPVTTRSDLWKFGSWVNRDTVFRFHLEEPVRAAVVDIMVENLGRVNFGRPHNFLQKKGLWEGPVLLDGNALENWEIMALEFEGPWVRSLQMWRPVGMKALRGPIAVRGFLHTSETPRDTFIDMSRWGKGVVFINGFNIGRYWSVGPQQTLYIPAPLLKRGQNTVIIFELYSTAPVIVFSDVPVLDAPSNVPRNLV